MFYRSTVVVLAASTILIARLDDSPLAAFMTDQSNSAMTVEQPAVLLNAPDTQLESETVVVSIPTPVIDAPSADSEVAMMASGHSMLLEPSTTTPVNLRSVSTPIPADVPAHNIPADAQPIPKLAAPTTNMIVNQPIDSAVPTYVAAPMHEAAPVYESAPIYATTPVYNAPPTYAAAPVEYAAPVYHMNSNVVYHSAPAFHQPTPAYVPNYAPTYAPRYATESPSHPALNTQNYSLFQYRRMMLNHSAPQPHELQGAWRGINKGIATVAIDERFIKDFRNVNGKIYGDNIEVQKNSGNWTPVRDRKTGMAKRQGKFLVQQARGIGPFGHSVVLNYSKGGNRKLDPANLISDQLVKLDDNHMLGRATAKFGPIRIPLAYFVLQRVPE